MGFWDGAEWVDDATRTPRQASKARRLFVHSWQALVEGALISLLVVGLIAGTAFAGKGGATSHVKSGGGGAIALRMVTDKNGNGQPNWGDTVTFDAKTSATPEPHVRLQCKLDGALVYSADAGMYASYPWPWEQDMTLSSSLWTSGAAACTAQIFYYSGSRTVWGTSLSFTVGA